MLSRFGHRCGPESSLANGLCVNSARSSNPRYLKKRRKKWKSQSRGTSRNNPNSGRGAASRVHSLFISGAISYMRGTCMSSTQCLFIHIIPKAHNGRASKTVPCSSRFLFFQRPGTRLVLHITLVVVFSALFKSAST